ncbi:cation-dependent mannose-6-phosphate receptor-like [Saccostrea echinata]|uniref:cation-dependent mannose-6-phosphate receptor-like n=1 Tax=Saccostrea echinata TaxID=191078 RepID=UPI002A83A4B2|nr:cation-dependent mannose-6-phosphate receptor-like [Saccostrea echinata]
MIGADCLWIMLIVTVHLVDVSLSDCKFPVHNTDRDLQKRIQPLVGKTFSGKDASEKYKYFFGVCTEALAKSMITGGETYGLLQKSVETNKFYRLGKYTNTTIISGNDWLILEYLDGEPYHSHCGSEPRRGRVMLNCDSSVSLGTEELIVLEEENNKTHDCFYLFEMKTSVVCPKTLNISLSLSVGTILIIVFLCVMSLYLILGCAYMRFVLHAKGKEQCPNYEFWQDFGNLQADGCDLVCRSKKPPGSRSYKGIGDDQLEGDDERDDHLLPM